MRWKCLGVSDRRWLVAEIGVWLSGEAWDETATQQLVKAARRNEISQGDVLSGKTRRAKDRPWDQGEKAP